MDSLREEGEEGAGEEGRLGEREGRETEAEEGLKSLTASAVFLRSSSSEVRVTQVITSWLVRKGKKKKKKKK